MKVTQEHTTEPDAGGYRQSDNWFSKDLMRFLVKVQGDPVSGCWNWTGALDRDNYARFRGENGTVQGHRWIYQILVGPIPDGLELDHLCYNPRCVAPYHLEPVTPPVNKRRRTSRRDEAAAGRPIRIKVGATTVCEFMFAAVLGLPVGGVVVLPARPGAGAVRSISPAPYGTLPLPLRPIQPLRLPPES
jgi:hypothetical protein